MFNKIFINTYRNKLNILCHYVIDSKVLAKNKTID